MPKLKAAGIAYRTPEGAVLLCKRSMKGDHPGEWAFVGGHIDDGETPAKAAIREFFEETGHLVPSVLPMGIWDEKFAAFGAVGPAFVPQLNDENLAYVWVNPGIDSMPQPMHPRALEILQSDAFKAMGLDEYEIAQKVAAGTLASPQFYQNVALFAVRVTGTGIAYRAAHEEFCWRDPSEYLNPEFLARCQGLPVILDHPEEPVLNGEQFQRRIVGTLVCPYIQGNEVWAVAKLYDMQAAKFLTENQVSTSPGVAFTDRSVNSMLRLADGSEVLIEGKPGLLDHLALCPSGVWDKGGPPAGVKVDNLGAIKMPEELSAEEKARQDSADKLDKLLSHMDSIGSRLDAMESRMDNMPSEVMTSMDKAKKDRKDRKDADEAADREKEEAARKDAEAAAEAARKDSAVIADRIAALEGRIPAALTDEQYRERADIQARYDSQYSMHGKHALRPLDGELPGSYRTRLLAGLQTHSATWSGVDLSKLETSALGIAEAQIFKDSAHAADHPNVPASAGLMASVRDDGTGRKVTTFHGHPSAWTSQFKIQSRRLAGINKE